MITYSTKKVKNGSVETLLISSSSSLCGEQIALLAVYCTAHVALEALKRKESLETPMCGTFFILVLLMQFICLFGTE
jgi:hypothetical protein